MNETSERNSGRAFAGFVLIAIGVAFMLDEMRIADFGWLIASYWPMILVLIGVSRLLQPGHRHRGIWLIGIGGWLQISNLGLWGFDWGTSWPILLVVIGTCVVLEAIVPESDRAPTKESPR